MYNNQSQLNRIFYTSAHQGLYELTPVVSNRALLQELWRVKVDSMFNLTWRHKFWSNSFLYIWPNQDKLRSLHTSSYQELYELTSIIANRALVQELWHVKVYSFLTWQFAKYQPPNSVKSIPPQGKIKILGLNKIPSHHNMMNLWLSHCVIDWSLYFIPTAPKLDSNDSEWHLFPAWMTIGASLMAHIRDKYYTLNQYMVI